MRSNLATIFLLALLAGCAPAPAPVTTTTPPPAAIPAPIAAPPSIQQSARWGEGSLNRAAWAPNGQAIALARSAGVALLDPATLAETGFWETPAPAGELAFSPDGRRLAVGELDGRIEIHAVPGGSLVQALQAGTDFAGTLAFSPDGTRLLFTDQMDHVRLWDLPASQEIGPSGSLVCSICSVGYSPSGQALAWQRDGDILAIWDVEQGKTLRSLSTAWVQASAFTPDFSQLAAGGREGRVQVWQARESGYTLQTSLAAEGGIWSVAYSPDGRSLAAGSDRAEIFVWEAPSGKLLQRFPAGQGTVTSLLFSPDGRSLLSSSAGGLGLWNPATGKQIQTLPEPPAYSGGTFLADGQLRGVLMSTAATALLDLTASRELFSLPASPPGSTWHLAPGPDGSLAAAHDTYTTLLLIDLRSGSTLQTFADFPGPLVRLKFSPDGRLLAGLFPTQASASDPQGILRVWDLSTRAERYSISIPLASELAFSPDGSRLALGGSAGKIAIHETAAGSRLLTLAGHPGAVTGLAYGPEGRLLVSGGQDGTLRTWNPATGQETRLLGRLAYPVRGASVPLRTGSLAVSPDGRLLASGGADGLLRLWDLAAGRQLLALPAGGEIESLQFNPNGTLLLSGDQFGTLRLWKITPN